MRFFKNSCKGGGWEVFTRSEGEARNGGGGWFYNGGMGNC